MPATDHQRPLLAVLLNPPSASSGNRSRGAVRRAAETLGYPGYVIVNLFAEPTATVIDLNDIDTSEASWNATQVQLEAHIAEAGGILAAWGIAGASAQLRREQRRRSDWILGAARELGHTNAWTVGGQPRHPSRWHQYVADKYGRAVGPTFQVRLSQVLESVPLDRLLAEKT